MSRVVGVDGGEEAAGPGGGEAFELGEQRRAALVEDAVPRRELPDDAAGDGAVVVCRGGGLGVENPKSDVRNLKKSQARIRRKPDGDSLSDFGLRI